MDSAPGLQGNSDQIAYWNGAAGRHWTDRQQAQDALLAPVSRLLVDRAHVAGGEKVIDVGCGCGATAIEIASKVGPAGDVLGIDISEPMLARARDLAPPHAPLSFVCADATTYAFAPAHADLMASRFGVMFFADPAASFANIRRGLRRGGRVAFACWRDPRDNPWLMTPLKAVYLHAPKLPPVGPEDPGPFAFASEERVTRILRAAGFADIAMEPCDLVLDIAGGGGLDAAVAAALEIGPASRALEGQPDAVRAAAKAAIRDALAPSLNGGAVPLGGSIWIVTARNP